MQTIVMTGGTSGFGALAVERMRRDSGNRLLLGGRGSTPEVSCPLELSSLESARNFVACMRATLDDGPIDALVLNAGLIRSNDRDRTVDGYETIFAVNYLSHYLITRSLLSDLRPGARIVLTTSGTHDPATKAGLVVPRHANAELLALPELDPNRDASPRDAAEHAYTSSKLCLAMLARSLDRLPEARQRGITTVAFDPGQVFGTGLARNLPLHMRLAWRTMGNPIASWPARYWKETLNTQTDAAETLARLALGELTAPDGVNYAALRRGRIRWTEPSQLARSDVACEELWATSARLAGLSQSKIETIEQFAVAGIGR